MTHLAQSLGFDLPDPFTRDSKLTTDFFQGPAISIHESEALLEHLPLALSQSLKHVFDLLFQEHDRGHIAWIFRALILDEIADIRLFALDHGGLEVNGLFRYFQD